MIDADSMARHSVVGEYSFQLQDMAAGFHFFEDGRFQFYFSYGAEDRNASGTFRTEGTTIKLQSDKEAGKDFTVIRQSAEGIGYTIQVEDSNALLLANIRCTFFIDGEKHDEFTDDAGEIQSDFAHCDKIYVQHTMFPDIVTLIKNEQNENNHFTLTLNPSLAQVSFKGIDFEIKDDNTITCLSNYFMPMEDIEFTRK